jgi:hypothetical protein
MRRLTAAALGLVLLGGCTDDHKAASAPSAAPSSASPPAVLAYIQAGKIFVADATGTSRLIAGTKVNIDQLRWSPDGTRLVWLDRQGDGLGTISIHIAPVSGGTAIEKPCPCSGVDFLGGQVVTMSADGTGLLLFAPDGTVSRSALDKPQPEGSGVVARLADRVIVDVPLDERTASYRGQLTLITVAADGKTSSVLKPAGAETSYRGGAVSPGADRLAFEEQPSSGACSSTSSLRTVKLSTGRLSDPGLPEDNAFDYAGLTDDRLMLNLEWAGTDLVVTFAPQLGCVSAPASSLVTYRWNEQGWTQLGTGWYAAAYGATAGEVAIAAPDNVPESVGAAADGRLTIMPRDQKITVAEHVSSFVLTPAEIAGGKAPAGKRPPTLEELLGDWVYECGDADTKLVVQPDGTGMLTSEIPSVDGQSPAQQNRMTLRFEPGPPLTATQTDGELAGRRWGVELNDNGKILRLTMDGGDEMELHRPDYDYMC